MPNKKLFNKFVNIDEKDEEMVINALRRKKLSGTAEIVEEYEKHLKNFFDSEYALACCNGTATLHVALLALGVNSGDEVIMPPTAPIMTALPILLIGGVPVFADCKAPNTFSYDLNDVRKKITDKTKAIITVPMWGYPIEMDGLLKISHENDIPILEDAAQTHGTKVNGKYLGTCGDVGSFSTHDRKLICTGEGGFLLTNNKDLYEKMYEIRAFGRVIRKTPELIGSYDKFGVLFGMNYKFNALGAALGISQLKKLNDKIFIRTKNAEYLKRHISGLQWIKEVPVNPLDTPNYFALVLEVDPSFKSGREVATHLLSDNIISDTYEYDYRPLYEMPLFQKFESQCPNTKALTERIITLPTHEGLTQDDLNRISDMLKAIT